MTAREQKRLERVERVLRAERKISALMEDVWPVFYAKLAQLKAENEQRKRRSRKPPTGASPIFQLQGATA